MVWGFQNIAQSTYTLLQRPFPGDIGSIFPCLALEKITHFGERFHSTEVFLKSCVSEIGSRHDGFESRDLTKTSLRYQMGRVVSEK